VHADLFGDSRMGVSAALIADLADDKTADPIKETDEDA
jgi:hypothetical protein